MLTKKEFLANHRTLEDIRKYLNVDSLEYLSIEGLVRAIGESKDKFCFACFNGDYPVPVPGKSDFDKYCMEGEEYQQGNEKNQLSLNI